MGKEKLSKEIALIRDEKIRNWTDKMLDIVPEQFWTIPASSSGKYHPVISNGPGGLVRHTKMMIQFALIFCRAYDLTQLDQDKIISACILHDVHKPDYEHAFKTSDWLEDKVGKNTDLKEIKEIIKWHMGRWSKGFTSKVDVFSRNQWICHLADMAVTCQKIIEFKFD